jgi:hypothetical protein
MEEWIMFWIWLCDMASEPSPTFERAYCTVADMDEISASIWASVWADNSVWAALTASYYWMVKSKATEPRFLATLSIEVLVFILETF